MAVVPMKKIYVYALKKQRKPILELIQRKGIVEVTDLAVEDSLFENMDTSKSVANFDRSILTAQQALETLGQYVPRKKSMFSSLNGPAQLNQEEFASLSAQHEQILKQASRIVQLSRQIAEDEADVVRLNNQIASLEPWLPLDVSMRLKGTALVQCYIGTFPEEYNLDDLMVRLAGQENMPEAVHVEIISKEREQTCVFLLCLKRDAPQVERGLRALGFSYPSAPSKTTPAEYSAVLDQRRKDKLLEIDQCRDELEKHGREGNAYENLEFLLDFYTMRKEKYEVIHSLAQSKNAFVLCGYLPAAAQEDVARALEPLGAAAEFEQPGKDEELPVLLQNNKFAEPTEGVVEMYSLPSKNDIDPTFLMSIFYYILFGLMLSDAAYGAIMVVGCGIVLSKFKNMGAGLKKTLKMFMYCGISTVFWGVLFGSYFGDVVNVVSKNYFGQEVSIPPLWFTPLNDPMKMLMFSFVLGIIHLYAGLAIQFYQLCREGDIKSAVFDVGLWYGLLTGLIVWLASTDMLKQMANLTYVIPSVVVTIAQIMAAVCAVGIVLTAGRSSRSPFKRLMKGAYGLYNVTGYLSDILSYSRLLALSLATGVIASVINTMGSMVGPSVFGTIVFTLVFIIGHVFNIGINLLGAYVHTNRLQYVEFFGKFYEGGGKKFSPFAANTKYFKIREEK